MDLGRWGMTARVELWGRLIGAVSWNADPGYATFQYTSDFARSGIELSPLMMPLAVSPYAFPDLPRIAFHGLPGLLADSLPDRFGVALVDAWLARQGRAPGSFTPVERLCYTGSRGMGALEYAPMLGPRTTRSEQLELDALVALASELLSRRRVLRGSLTGSDRERTMRDILRIGTSAGGARAKAVIAWNRATGEVRAGQLPPDPGFELWLLKFDGVKGNRDRELADPGGYGAIEYAYHRMAVGAGIIMNECRLLEEGGRRHFMTRRFDRTPEGGKLHMQSLGALLHLDFNQAGAHSYEQALLAIRRLELPMQAVEQQFRRMVFNIVARNQDDHVKNIAFLMDRTGHWSLAPAFDLTYAFNPSGAWTATHQMTLNGKRDGFSRSDLRQCGKSALMKRGRADAILDEVLAAVQLWPECAAEAGVPERIADRIGKTHRRAIAWTRADQTA